MLCFMWGPTVWRVIGFKSIWDVALANSLDPVQPAGGSRHGGRPLYWGLIVDLLEVSLGREIITVCWVLDKPLRLLPCSWMFCWVGLSMHGAGLASTVLHAYGRTPIPISLQPEFPVSSCSSLSVLWHDFPVYFDFAQSNEAALQQEGGKVGNHWLFIEMFFWNVSLIIALFKNMFRKYYFPMYYFFKLLKVAFHGSRLKIVQGDGLSK